MKAERKVIDDFLGQKRLAMVGVSRTKKHFSRMLFRDLRKFGYDIVPVHPTAAEIDGVRCVSSVKRIEPPVDGALLMTRPQVTEAVVKECADAGIRRVWMYRAAGQGSVSPRAVEFCRSQGISVVPGHCPYMFLPQAAWFHRLHGFFARLTGSYPS